MALGGYAGAFLAFLVATLSSLYTIAVVRSFSVGLPRLAAAIPLFAAYFALPPLAADPRENAVLSILLTAHFSWWANFKLLALCFGEGPLLILEPHTPPKEAETSSNNPTTSLKQPNRDSQNEEKLRQRKRGGEGDDGEGKTEGGGTKKSKREWPNYWGFTAILVLPLVVVRPSAAGGKWEENAGTPWPDFWGRRWNRVAGQLLRDSTYRPIKSVLVHYTLLGRAPTLVPHLIAVFLTFATSGLMHELILYNAAGYINGATFEWTAFFLIHAVGVVFEGCLWEVAKRYRLRPLPRLVTFVWTALFFLWTTPWLFFEPLKRTGFATLALSEFRQLMPGASLMSLIGNTQ